MKLEVSVFAAAREAVGRSSVQVSVPPFGKVSDLRMALLDECPALKQMSSALLIAVNNEYAADSHVLSEADSIACFPPVSGG